MCRAVNLRTESFDVYIGRAGRGQSGDFGNPFIVGVHGDRGECVLWFNDWFLGKLGNHVLGGPVDNEKTCRNGWPRAVQQDPFARAYREHVVARIKKGDRLGCFCKPAACHGDVIAAYVNSR